MTNFVGAAAGAAVVVGTIACDVAFVSAAAFGTLTLLHRDTSNAPSNTDFSLDG